MRTEEIRKMVESTSDPAFAADGQGLIVAWNQAAEALFALSASEAVGRPCGEIVKGSDECGSVCSQDCTVRQAVTNRRPISNFDFQIETPTGKQWCNTSVLIVENGGLGNPFALHIIRSIDLRKRLEILVKDFVVGNISVPAKEAVTLISMTRSAARQAQLTERELQILRLLAKGATTREVADRLRISRTTVNNHVQHILHKLDSHTRLEAVRRAEHAGLI